MMQTSNNRLTALDIGSHINARPEPRSYASAPGLGSALRPLRSRLTVRKGYKLPRRFAYCWGSSLGGNRTASVHGDLWRLWARRLWSHQRSKRHPDTGAYALPIAIREMPDKHWVSRERQCREKTAKD